MPIIPHFSHHVGGGRRQEGEEGDEDHKQKGEKRLFRNKAKLDQLSKVDGGETVTETTTTMSRETSGTLGSKETSGSLGREENEQPLALRSKVFLVKFLPGNIKISLSNVTAYLRSCNVCVCTQIQKFLFFMNSVLRPHTVCFPNYR